MGLAGGVYFPDKPSKAVVGLSTVGGAIAGWAIGSMFTPPTQAQLVAQNLAGTRAATSITIGPDTSPYPAGSGPAPSTTDSGTTGTGTNTTGGSGSDGSGETWSQWFDSWFGGSS